MTLAFTPAMERALAEAAAWSTGQTPEILEAPALLLGLLAESECRAAIALAEHGIDADSVQGRWPTLKRSADRFLAWKGAGCSGNRDLAGGTPVRRFAPEIDAALAEVARSVLRRFQTVELATEHVLLALAAWHEEVGGWLRQRGVSAQAIEEQICRLRGPCPEQAPASAGQPLDFPEPSEVSPAPHGIGPPGGPRIDPPGPRPAALGSPGSSVDTSAAPGAASRAVFMAQERIRALRVIDAAANRAREGLRVVEDYARFVLDDLFLTTQLKGLRHELTALLERFSLCQRLAARETQADVGTQVTTATERLRENTAGVLAANFTRLQESLRSLEEYGKTLDPDASAGFEQLRYRTYTLQRAVETVRASLERLERARLYVLIDGRATLEEFCAVAQALVSGGVHVIQLRDKQLDDRRLLERARLLRDITGVAEVLFIINDRPDLAVLARADGVHVGQEELSVKDARTMVGPEALIGVSTHSIEQARQAVLDGANYLGVGPVFPSGTKHFDRFPGVELLRAVTAEIRLPVFAIGGIGLNNLAEVLQTGIRRIAVSGAVLNAPDPAATARGLAQRLNVAQCA